MKFNNYISVLFYITIFAIFICGCSSDFDDENPDLEKVFKIDLFFSYNGEWIVKDSNENEEDIKTYIEDYIQIGTAHHIIFVYQADKVSSGSQPFYKLELKQPLDGSVYDFPISLSLPTGDYVVKALTVFDDMSEKEPFYNTTGFPQVSLTRHSVLKSYQDIFSGTQNIKVNANSSEIRVDMKRPVGRYFLISEDFSSFMKETGNSPEDVNVVVAYSGFYPDFYSVISDRLTDSVTGEKYILKPVNLKNGLSVVGADYMLMNPGGSSVTLQIFILNKNWEMIASTDSMTIPMSRNETVIMRGIVLRKTSENGGGFDMDTGFDGDFVIKD